MSNETNNLKPNKLNKALLFMGNGLGKTTLAQKIAIGYRNPFFYNPTIGKFNNVLVSTDQEIPDLVVVDAIKSIEIIKYYNWITEGIPMRKIYSSNFELIKADFILISCDSIEKLKRDTSFDARFSLIEFHDTFVPVIQKSTE
jgi:hypothetical protein